MVHGSWLGVPPPHPPTRRGPGAQAGPPAINLPSNAIIDKLRSKVINQLINAIIEPINPINASKNYLITYECD